MANVLFFIFSNYSVDIYFFLDSICTMIMILNVCQCTLCMITPVSVRSLSTGITDFLTRLILPMLVAKHNLGLRRLLSPSIIFLTCGLVTLTAHLWLFREMRASWSSPVSRSLASVNTFR